MRQRAVALMVGLVAVLGFAGAGGWYLRDISLTAAEQSAAQTRIDTEDIQSAIADGIKTAQFHTAWQENPTKPAVTVAEVRLRRRKLAYALIHPDYRDVAARLDRHLAAAEQELDRIKTLPADATESINLRIGYARRVEITLLAEGFDAHVELSEPNKLGMIIRYVAMSRPLVHRFSTDENLRTSLKSIGFTALTLTDGRSLWETFDL